MTGKELYFFLLFTSLVRIRPKGRLQLKQIWNFPDLGGGWVWKSSFYRFSFFDFFVCFNLNSKLITEIHQQQHNFSRSVSDTWLDVD